MMLRNKLKILCICAVLLAFVEGQAASATCFDMLHTDDPVNCTRFCIEKFYDKLGCKTVLKGSSLSTIVNNSTGEVLAHDYYNSTMVANKMSDCNDTDNEAAMIVYRRPVELIQLETSSEQRHHLYMNLTNKFMDKEKWCIKMLRLDQMMERLDNGTEAMPLAGVESSSLDNIETTTEIIVEAIETTSNPVQNTSDATITEHSPIPHTTKSSTINKRRTKPVLEDHHYSGALFYIGIISISFSVVLLACAAAICFYTTRRRRLDFRYSTSSVPLNYT